MPFKQRWTNYIQYLILLLLLYFVLFIKLGNFQIRWWDESVFAVNSYEMFQNGKYFSLYFDNMPDFFNLKPPLSFWLQLIFIKIFGYSELSLRLPSAIAAGLTVIITFRFVSQYFNYVWAWFSALILITSSGFIGFHTARTADSDALLTLFLLLTNLYFIKFIITQNKIYIVFFFAFLLLSFSTKSFASLFFSPAYLFIIIQKRMLKQFIVNWKFLISLLFFVGIALSLLILREKDTPGYINALIFSDISRFSNTIWSEHKHDTLFYLYNLFETRFAFWSVFFVTGSVLLIFKNNSLKKQILYFFFVLILLYFIIISLSLTKLYWYDMPLFPYLSVIAAYPLYMLIESIRYRENQLTLTVKYFIICLCFMYPYTIVFNKSQANTIPIAEKHMEANEIFIHKKFKKQESMDGVKIYYTGWKGGLLFYKYKLAENNQIIHLTNDFNNILINDKVLVCNDSLKIQLSDTYNIILEESCLNAYLYSISSKK